jgi:hypothetical protein
VLPVDSGHRQVGEDWMSVAKCFRRRVRVEPAQIGAAAIVSSCRSGLD